MIGDSSIGCWVIDCKLEGLVTDAVELRVSGTEENVLFESCAMLQVPGEKFSYYFTGRLRGVSGNLPFVVIIDLAWPMLAL